MEIDGTSLYQIILKVIQKMLDENLIPNFSVPERSRYVILTENWKEEYGTFFRTLENRREYRIFTVIPPSMANDYYIKKLKECGDCGTVLKQNEVSFEALPDSLTVFPVVPRDLVAKTALCISDTFETKWIQNCMANGRKIVLLKSGLEPFTGKEPKAYVSRIQEYYKMIAEYGIEIKEDIKTAGSIPPQNRIADAGQKVITEGDIDRFVQNRQIVLHPGDLITALAKEKALRLGIDIIRQ